MQVASLELCKELYELSGWECDYWYDWNHGEPTVEDMRLSEFNIPAYDSGFLLRKLPAYVYSRNYEQKAYLWQRKDADNKYCAWYRVNDPITYGEEMRSEHGSVADTPEDALASLAIELFKQEVLK